MRWRWMETETNHHAFFCSSSSSRNSSRSSRSSSSSSRIKISSRSANSSISGNSSSNSSSSSSNSSLLLQHCYCNYHVAWFELLYHLYLIKSHIYHLYSINSAYIILTIADDKLSLLPYLHWVISSSDSSSACNIGIRSWWW